MEGGLWTNLIKGGWVMLPLLFCSILSLAIFAERLWFIRKSRVSVPELIDRIRPTLKKKESSECVAVCDQQDASVPRIFKAGLLKRGNGNDAVRLAVQVQTRQEMLLLSRWVGAVGTIGNIAPFIGLFGTVLGIVRAFRDIAGAGSGGTSVVMSGLAEALVATAGGLFVAIPAVIFYNILVHSLDRRQIEMENAADQLVALLDEEGR